MTDSPITWAVLAPASARRLAPMVRDAWIGRCGSDDEEMPWEVVECSGRYTAIVDRTPGSEGADDQLAVDLSVKVKGTVYALRFREDAEVVWAFERGRLVQEETSAPRPFAEKLGCVFVGPRRQPRSKTRSLCVIEGVEPEAVRNALGDAHPRQPFALSLAPSVRFYIPWAAAPE